MQITHVKDSNCEKSYSKAGELHELKSYDTTVHDRKKSFQCVSCEKRFSSNQSVGQHKNF